MLSERLDLAIARGLVSIPQAGRIGVFGLGPTDRIDVLPREQVDVIARHFPVYAHFRELGYATPTKPSGRYALSIVTLPRSKSDARQMIAQAMDVSDGPIVVDGQKTDGIDAILKELRKHTSTGDVLAKAHGKISVVERADLSDWSSPDGYTLAEGFQTAPGVFSSDGVDPGSALLARSLPKALKGRIVDLGAGWGYLSAAILKREGVESIDLVETDHVALDMARMNISDARATFHWDDAKSFLPDEPADHVVTNPPFHIGRATDPSLGQAFITQSARMLKPRGSLWLVANRHLPYEAVLRDAFTETRALDETSSYKVFQASHPRRARKG